MRTDLQMFRIGIIELLQMWKRRRKMMSCDRRQHYHEFDKWNVDCGQTTTIYNNSYSELSTSWIIEPIEKMGDWHQQLIRYDLFFWSCIIRTHCFLQTVGLMLQLTTRHQWVMILSFVQKCPVVSSSGINLNRKSIK